MIVIKKLTLLLVLPFFSVSLFAQSPPTYLFAIEGDEEVTLFWQPPGVVLTEGETCALPIQGGTITDGFSENFSGTTVGFENDYVDSSSANGPDVVYEFTVDGNLDVIFSLCDNATWDTYLILLGPDCETQVAFDDDGCVSGLQSEINGTLGSGTYFLVVDGWGSTSEGEYTLSVSATGSDRTSGVFQPSITDENKYERDGTTVPFHEPVPFIVNPDHARNSRDVEVNITCDGGLYQWEVSWEILDESGAIVASGGAPVSESFYLNNGVYTVNGLDSYGDGWNENYLSVVNAAYDEEYLNWTIVDGFDGTTTFEIDYTIVAGDLIGYNAYVDGSQHNNDIIQSRNYSVDGLVNNTTYELGVTAVYYVNENETEESEPVTISATPTFLYGDIAGVVTDPNGATLDSVIVSSGGESDTTGTDGTFTLWNLNTGSQTVTLSRLGFSSVTIDTMVLAQAEPTVLDVMLSPDMPRPVGLSAVAGDTLVHLSWYTPGGMELYELFYDDGVHESSITGGDDQVELAVLFNPNVSGEIIQGRFMFTDIDGFGFTSEPVEIRVYTTSQTEPPVLVYTGEELMEVSALDVWLDYEFPTPIPFDEDGFLLGFRFTTTTGPGIARDETGYVLDHSYVNFGDNVWNETGLLGFPGNYMIRAVAALEGEPEGTQERHLTVLSGGNQISAIIDHENTGGFEYSEENITVQPRLLAGNRTREDVLDEYKVYGLDSLEYETLVATTTDTFTTIVVSSNYQEYCYHVRAVWDTGDPSDGGYGQLESRPSNVACTVPYALGDADFDSEVTINDVLEVVDFILEEDVPTEDQFRNCDINSDEEINIADVVMMVDIIFGGTGRVVGFDAGQIAYIDLKTDFKKSLLTFEIEYNGPVRGIEFELKFDPTMVNIMPPSLLNFQENVMISYTEKEPGILKVLAANLKGGHIEATNNSYMSIPVKFMGNERDIAFVTLEGIKLAGADGSLINTVARTNSSEVKVIPGAFALHQNFPNPFNPSTEIRFDLPEAGNVNLAIYNLMGQKIRTLSSDNMTPGYHAIIWDGTNDIGSQVATGMYFYSIQSSEFQATKKMLFLK